MKGTHSTTHNAGSTKALGKEHNITSLILESVTELERVYAARDATGLSTEFKGLDELRGSP